MKGYFSYDDVTFVPRERSDITSRDNCDTGVGAFGLHLDLPLIAAPMDKVCNGTMAAELARKNCLGIIHCKQSIEEQVKQFNIAYVNGMNNRVACAIGVTKDYLDRFNALVIAGCRIFCLDTANGFSSVLENAYKKCYHNFPSLTNDRVYFIGGNVASAEGYAYLSDLRFDAVRVGIAGGSVCETKTETGVHAPTLWSVNECAEWRKYQGQWDGRKFPLIIADGGIRKPEDMHKALVFGADLVMAGNIFAGCDEAPGDVEFGSHNEPYKVYRGSASYGTQLESTGNVPFYVEGKEMHVPARGAVKYVLNRYKAGLRSSMSYHNALNLDSYRINAKKSLLFT